MGEVLRWAEATIEWANGDPAKGNLIVGSPFAVALAMRGLARSWFGRPGWRKDLDDAVGFAEQSGDPLTLAVIVSFTYGVGIWIGTFRADDVAVRTIEKALQTAEASGDDYAVDVVKFLLGCALLIRGVEGDRSRGLELLTQLRETWIQQRYGLTELPVLDVYLGQDKARGGDLDGGIRMIRKSLDDLWTRGQVPYYTRTTSVLVETLLERGADGDAAEADAATARLAAEPADGSVVREIWLLRLRALLARAKGDDARYVDYRDRYREMARSLGFEGHIAWAEEMP
jgi:hypothetical protein